MDYEIVELLVNCCKNNIISKEQYRDTLKNIRLDMPSDKTLRVTACDGHKLVESVFEGESSAHEALRIVLKETGLKEYVIEYNALLILAKSFKRKAQYRFTTCLSKVTPKVIINNSLEVNLFISTFAFPDTDFILRNITCTSKISFNADYLLKLAKTIKCKNDIVVLEYDASGELKPLVIQNKNHKAVLMSCRITEA